MSEGELVLYRTPDGLTEIQLRAIEGSVWLTQAQIAELFDTSPQAITQLIKSICREGELTEEATCKEFLQVRTEGRRQVQRTLRTYRLEMILAVGYRVRSARGTQFRQWATTALREYLVKGFVMNDQRLKDPGGFDYFDELLERIRDIRASEKRFYQKVREVFAATSADYDTKSDTAQLFFQTIQNKMLFAVTGQTAAELIVARADSSTEYGAHELEGYEGSQGRRGQEEITELNRIVTMFLDFAEDLAKRRKQVTMADWMAQTDRFLTFNERNVLGNAGRMSHDRMESVASEQYGAFEAARRESQAIPDEAEEVEELKRIEDAVRRKADG